MGRVVAWPGSPTHHAAQLEKIEHLLAIKAEVDLLLEKVDRYRIRGYERIGLASFDKLRAAVEGQ
jgi:hypothetical protein